MCFFPLCDPLNLVQGLLQDFVCSIRSYSIIHKLISLFYRESSFSIYLGMSKITKLFFTQCLAEHKKGRGINTHLPIIYTVTAYQRSKLNKFTKDKNKFVIGVHQFQKPFDSR